MEGVAHEEQSQQEAVRSVPNSPKSTTDSNLSQYKIKGKIQKRSSRSAAGPSSTKSAKPKPKLTFKDLNMNKLVFQEGGIPDNTELNYIVNGKKLLDGYKQGRGIRCDCCKRVISPSQFEAHANQASRKKPYNYIFISNSVSLHQYAASLKMKSKSLVKKNDSLCGVCKEGGNLLCCDGCPRSFHKGCASGAKTYQKKWFCKFCCNSMKCLGSNGNAIEQITKRRIRIVDNPEKYDLVACSLCRSCKFSKMRFNDQTVIVCDQCEKEYHVGCLRDHKIADLKELPAGNWFCTMECGRLNSVLKNLVNCGPEKVPDSLMDVIKKLNDADVDGTTNFDMTWIVVCGKDASDENRLFLSEAVDIFHECFDPVIDSITGGDFIPSMAYGLKMGDSDFVGVHTALLMIGSKVITAGMFRIFGQEMAELPIVATHKLNQGKGYFHLFFTCFEKLLAYLKVKKIVLPAADNAKPMWISKFGFDEVTPRQLSEYRETQTSMVAFEGTTLLEKEVNHGQITFEDGVNFSLAM